MDIYNLVKERESTYTQESPTKLGKYVDWSMYETIQKIIAYLNSKHVSGEYDALGRKKPFFNIVTAAVNVWYKATDIDRKDISIKATVTENYFKAFVATLRLRDWMRRENFGQVLNIWGRTLAQYGSSVLKFVEKDGRLIPSVVDWNTLICDVVDFAGNVKIEKIPYTPAQLRSMTAYDQDVVEDALDAVKTRTLLDGEQIDVLPDYLEVYEVHGNLPLSYLTGKDKDEDTYRQQMHVVFVYENKSDPKKNECLTLYSGREARDPYRITHLIPETGRTLSIGAVEHLFEAQWQMNHTVKQIRDQLELASKMILQTADQNFVGRNVLTEVEVGDILTYADQAPLTQVNNSSHDIPSMSGYMSMWKDIAREQTGTFEAVSGETMPSGTPWSLGAMLNREANSLFGLMTQNKGLYLEEIIRDFVIPHFKKTLNTTEEVMALLTSDEILEFDSLALPQRLLEEVQVYISGGMVGDEPTMDSVRVRFEEEMAPFGNTRPIRPSEGDMTWKEYFKDLEWDVRIDVTGEETDKNATLQTLMTMLQTLAGNPAILQDPNAKMIFNKIIEEAGQVSPVAIRTGVPQGMQQGVPQALPESVGVEAPAQALTT